jgi:hypothetical protein
MERLAEAISLPAFFLDIREFQSGHHLLEIK